MILNEKVIHTFILIPFNYFDLVCPWMQVALCISISQVDKPASQVWGEIERHFYVERVEDVFLAAENPSSRDHYDGKQGEPKLFQGLIGHLFNEETKSV